jgi:Protein of unknown function (DUF5674)
MRIIQDEITKAELETLAANGFGNMVKAVVDIKKGVMAVDADLHADLEALLLGEGSAQSDIWGINLYPELTGDDFVEFDSMINLRPLQNNRTRGVEDAETQKNILAIVNTLVKK